MQNTPVILGRPHLVLSDIGGDVRVCAAGQAVQGLDHHLGLDDLAALAVLETLTAAPLPDLRPPSLQFLSIRTRRGFAYLGRQLGQDLFDVAHDRHIHLHSLGNGRRVDIDMDDLSLY